MWGIVLAHDRPSTNSEDSTHHARIVIFHEEVRMIIEYIRSFEVVDFEIYF